MGTSARERGLQGSRIARWLLATLIIGASTIIGGTVLRDPIANAAQLVNATIVGPLDANGNLKVREQGTMSVNVSNATVPVEQAGTPLVLDFPAQQEGGVFVVPNNKRLVIQYVNAKWDITAATCCGAEDGVLNLIVDGPMYSTYLFVGDKSTDQFGDLFRVVSEPVTIYASGGSLVYRGNEEADVQISGYLLDART